MPFERFAVLPATSFVVCKAPSNRAFLLSPTPDVLADNVNVSPFAGVLVNVKETPLNVIGVPLVYAIGKPYSPLDGVVSSIPLEGIINQCNRQSWRRGQVICINRNGGELGRSRVRFIPTALVMGPAAAILVVSLMFNPRLAAP